ANRNRAELEPLIGFFANTLVFAVDLEDDPGFAELLGRVRATALGAYEHQDMPFEKLVDALDLERSLSHTPLFQVAFVLQNLPFEAPEDAAGRLRMRSVEMDGGTAKFDLTLAMAPFGEGLAAPFEYSSDLFDATT